MVAEGGSGGFETDVGWLGSDMLTTLGCLEKVKLGRRRLKANIEILRGSRNPGGGGPAAALDEKC